MKFSAMPYSRPDLEAMKANLTACTEAFLAAESAQEQIAQYDRVTDLSVEFNTMGSLANARHTIDTRDAFYDAESTFFDESWPQLSVYFQRLNEAMLDSKFRPELEAHYGSLAVPEARDQPPQLQAGACGAYAGGKPPDVPLSEALCQHDRGI